MFLVGWAASDVGVKLMNTWLTETRLAAQLQQFSCFRIGGGASMQTVMDKIMKTLSHELTNVSLSAKSGVICSGLMIFGVCRSLIQFVAICWFFVVTLCLDCISFVFLFDVIVIDRLSWNSAVSCMALLCWRSSMSTPSSRIFLGWMIMMNWPVSCNTVRRFASRSLRFGLIAEGFLIEDSDECHWFWCMPRLMTCWLNSTTRCEKMLRFAITREVIEVWGWKIYHVFFDNLVVAHGNRGNLHEEGKCYANCLAAAMRRSQSKWFL